MSLVFRTLLLLTYALFWGGLTFYTGFVTRISERTFEDTMQGGLLTQQVTVVLQWLGVAAAVVLLVNAVAAIRTCLRRGWAMVGCSVLLALAVAGLFVVHGDLDAVISIENEEVTDRDVFTIGHRRYNQLTTVEFIATVAYLPLALSVWRTQDQRLSVESTG